MRSELHFDHSLWKGVIENDKPYCLSAESGVSSIGDLQLTDECIEKVRSSLLIKTSGSSGPPKWVIHSKLGLLTHASLVNEHLGVKEDDIFGLLLPTYHVGGLGLVLRANLAMAMLRIYTDRWSARGCVDFLIKNRVSITSMVPTQLVDIVSEGMHCPVYVRIVVVGGGRLDSEIRTKAVQLGWPIQESYGMTETGSQIATGELTDNSYLRMMNGWQVRHSSDKLLEVKGECLFKGYLEGDEGFYSFIDPKVDGWFTTNDRVDLREIDGEVGVKFLGRNDLQVKILGELVDIYILENNIREILQHEIYIIPLADERRGVKLFPVVEEASLAAVIHDLGWKGLYRLEETVVVASFPRNMMGKLQRAKLLETVESIVFSAD